MQLATCEVWPSPEAQRQVRLVESTGLGSLTVAAGVQGCPQTTVTPGASVTVGGRLRTETGLLTVKVIPGSPPRVSLAENVPLSP